MKNITVTNPELFNAKVDDIFTEQLMIGEKHAQGSITIQYYPEGEKKPVMQTFSGEHGLSDYEEDFGFILTPDEN
jgi:hypothetical protein